MEEATAANELDGLDLIDQQPGAAESPGMTAWAIENEFELAVQYDYNNRQRNRENWQQYAGIDNSQYGPEALAQATAEGRHVDTFNIITQKVDSLAGAIIKNPFDMDFVAVEETEAEDTQALNQASLSDKELMDWDVSHQELVLGGLVYEAVEEMYIDKRNHPLGNIAFRTSLPGQVIFDPNWKTQSGKDCQKCWKVSWLTAEQIKQLWPKLSTLLDAELDQDRGQGADFDEMSKGPTPNFDVLQDPSTTGSKYRVVQFYEMVREKVWEEYDEMTGIVIPSTDDIAFKKAWLDERNPEWEADKLRKREIDDMIQYCTVIIPQLAPNRIIDRKPTAVQIKRLQFFAWSASRINGVPRGIVDLIKDIQRNINHREMLISFIIESSAQGGEVMDPMLFNNDQNQIDEYISSKNQPNRTFIAAPGAVGRGLMPQKLRKNDFPNDIQAQLVRMWDYADRISKSPAAYDARTEGSGESGYLFAQKVRQAEQQQYILFAGLKRHLNEKGEAYMEQAKKQYSIGGWQRDFMVPGDENETVSVNKKVKMDNGQVIIQTDFSQLPRHKVVVTESPAGLTNRLVARAVSAEVMNSVPPENIGTRAVLTGTIINSIDTFSGDDKQRLKKFRALEEKQAEETLKLGIENLKFQQETIKKQLEQLQNPTPPAAPGPGGPGGPGGQPALPPPGPSGGGELGGPLAIEAQRGGNIEPDATQAVAPRNPNPDRAGGAPGPV